MARIAPKKYEIECFSERFSGIQSCHQEVSKQDADNSIIEQLKGSRSSRREYASKPKIANTSRIPVEFSHGSRNNSQTASTSKDHQKRMSSFEKGIPKKKDEFVDNVVADHQQQQQNLHQIRNPPKLQQTNSMQEFAKGKRLSLLKQMEVSQPYFVPASSATNKNLVQRKSAQISAVGSRINEGSISRINEVSISKQNEGNSLKIIDWKSNDVNISKQNEANNNYKEIETNNYQINGISHNQFEGSIQLGSSPKKLKYRLTDCLSAAPSQMTSSPYKFQFQKVQDENSQGSNQNNQFASFSSAIQNNENFRDQGEAKKANNFNNFKDKKQQINLGISTDGCEQPLQKQRHQASSCFNLDKVQQNIHSGQASSISLSGQGAGDLSITNEILKQQSKRQVLSSKQDSRLLLGQPKSSGSQKFIQEVNVNSKDSFHAPGTPQLFNQYYLPIPNNGIEDGLTTPSSNSVAQDNNSSARKVDLQDINKQRFLLKMQKREMKDSSENSEIMKQKPFQLNSPSSNSQSNNNNNKSVNKPKISSQFHFLVNPSASNNRSGAISKELFHKKTIEENSFDYKSNSVSQQKSSNNIQESNGFKMNKEDSSFLKNKHSSGHDSSSKNDQNSFIQKTNNNSSQPHLHYPRHLSKQKSQENIEQSSASLWGLEDRIIDKKASDKKEENELKGKKTMLLRGLSMQQLKEMHALNFSGVPINNHIEQSSNASEQTSARIYQENNIQEITPLSKQQEHKVVKINRKSLKLALIQKQSMATPTNGFHSPQIQGKQNQKVSAGSLFGNNNNQSSIPYSFNNNNNNNSITNNNNNHNKPNQIYNNSYLNSQGNKSGAFFDNNISINATDWRQIGDWRFTPNSARGFRSSQGDCADITKFLEKAEDAIEQNNSAVLTPLMQKPKQRRSDFIRAAYQPQEKSLNRNRSTRNHSQPQNVSVDSKKSINHRKQFSQYASVENFPKPNSSSSHHNLNLNNNSRIKDIEEVNRSKNIKIDQKILDDDDPFFKLQDRDTSKRENQLKPFNESNYETKEKNKDKVNLKYVQGSSVVALLAQTPENQSPVKQHSQQNLPPKIPLSNHYREQSNPSSNSSISLNQKGQSTDSQSNWNSYQYQQSQQTPVNHQETDQSPFNQPKQQIGMKQKSQSSNQSGQSQNNSGQNFKQTLTPSCHANPQQAQLISQRWESFRSQFCKKEDKGNQQLLNEPRSEYDKVVNLSRQNMQINEFITIEEISAHLKKVVHAPTLQIYILRSFHLNTVNVKELNSQVQFKKSLSIQYPQLFAVTYKIFNNSPEQYVSVLTEYLQMKSLKSIITCFQTVNERGLQQVCSQLLKKFSQLDPSEAGQVNLNFENILFDKTGSIKIDCFSRENSNSQRRELLAFLKKQASFLKEETVEIKDSNQSSRFQSSHYLMVQIGLILLESSLGEEFLYEYDDEQFNTFVEAKEQENKFQTKIKNRPCCCFLHGVCAGTTSLYNEQQTLILSNIITSQYSKDFLDFVCKCLQNTSLNILLVHPFLSSSTNTHLNHTNSLQELFPIAWKHESELVSNSEARLNKILSSLSNSLINIQIIEPLKKLTLSSLSENHPFVDLLHKDLGLAPWNILIQLKEAYNF